MKQPLSTHGRCSPNWSLEAPSAHSFCQLQHLNKKTVSEKYDAKLKEAVDHVLFALQVHVEQMKHDGWFRLFTNSLPVAGLFQMVCPGKHQQKHLVGGRAEDAFVYAQGLSVEDCGGNASATIN